MPPGSLARSPALTHPPHRRKWHENNKAEYNAKRRKAARVKAAEKRLVAAMPRAVPPPKSLFCPLLPPATLPPMVLPNSYSLGAGLLSLYSSPYFAMGAMLRMPPPPPPVAMMAPTGMMMPFAAAAPQQQQFFVGFNKY